MARHEADREDLLLEATALVERVAMCCAFAPETIVAGFRASGAASIYFGADLVLHFNSRGELRRAFFMGRLAKAERGHLVVLERHRSSGEVALARTLLAAEEEESLLGSWRALLTLLANAIQAGDARLVGQVPADAEVASRLAGWLRQLPDGITIARSPHAR